MHYLEQELQDLFRRDSRIVTFLDSGSLDGLWYWDLENPENEWMSQSFWRLFGYDPADMPHRSDAWQDIIDPDDLASALDNFHRHCADPAYPYDQIVRYRHRDGSTVTVRCRGIAIRDEAGKPVRMLGAHTDLTELKRTEAALRDTNAELLRQRDRAEAASLAKSTFLATLSHEIRTPLSGVLGMASALEQTPLSAQQAEMLDVVNRSGARLMKLLNDILDLSKVEAGETNVDQERLDLHELCEETVGLYRVTAERKGLSLVAKVPEGTRSGLVGATARIRQMLDNLTANAVKFTAEGKVEVSAQTRQGDDGSLMAEFRVADTGPGVPDRRKAEIFEAFKQASVRTSTDYGGTGLGLTIVRSICDLLGGRVRIEDTPGGGATFVLTVPIKALSKTRPKGVAASSPQDILSRLPALDVLVAEDNETNRFVVQALLATTKIRLTLANDGAEALEKLAAQSFDAALIDIRMPRVNGIEVVERHRAYEAENGLSRLPIVAFTANVMGPQVDSYIAAGFDGTLAKPVDIGALAAFFEDAAQSGKLGQTG